MALHPEFPESPYAVLLPDRRWFPAAEELRTTAYEKLLPPLVAKVRGEITPWRDSGYVGASETSRGLLNWWFETEHLVEQADGTLSPFRYYFAQREAIETVIWLHDVHGVRDKFDLLRIRCLGRGLGGDVRRGLAALRGEDGYRQRQDQGDFVAHRLELLS